MSEIRWRRGFLRVWVVLTLIWIGGLAVLGQPHKKWSEIQAAIDIVERAIEAQKRVKVGIDDGQLTKSDGTMASADELEVDLARLEAIRRAGQEKKRRAVESFRKQIVAIIGFPLALLFTGFTVSWVIKGFAKS